LSAALACLPACQSVAVVAVSVAALLAGTTYRIVLGGGLLLLSLLTAVAVAASAQRLTRPVEFIQGLWPPPRPTYLWGLVKGAQRLKSLLAHSILLSNYRPPSLNNNPPILPLAISLLLTNRTFSHRIFQPQLI
jgi:hypothetical protein